MGSQADSFLDQVVCKRFKTGGQSANFFGVVVAQTHPEDDMVLFKVVYQDGDFEDCSYDEVEEGVKLYVERLPWGEEEAEKVAMLPEMAAEWREQAVVWLGQQRDSLRRSLKGITFAVMVPKDDQRDDQWFNMRYKVVNPQVSSGPVRMRKQVLEGSTLLDDPTQEDFVWSPWEPLGSYTSVQASADGLVSDEERERLERWYAADGADRLEVYSEQVPLSMDKKLITSYFPASVKKGKAVFPRSEGVGATSAEQPVWSGHRLRGNVCFDWDSMQARVEVIHPYLRVARSGKWVFYKAGSDVPEATVSGGRLTLEKQKRVKTHYVALGELDKRVAEGAMALAEQGQDWTALVPFVCVSQVAEEDGPARSLKPKSKHLHWIFTEHLHSAVGASQFVGSPPTVCSFGFTEVVYGSEALPLTRELDRRRHTVVWLDEYKQGRIALLRELRGMTGYNVVLVMSYSVRIQVQKSKWLPLTVWAKVCTFPVGTPIMLSANQFDLTPKASVKVLEVWVNRRARVTGDMESLREFPGLDEPLLTVHNMAGGRWEHFHRGSQDYKYKEFEGIVAATDGSVVNDPEEGLCMGGGVAFREGDHGLVDEQVRVFGHVSSFVAEGAAASVLLGMTPKDIPLAIFTDSANIMFAMQHCSRRERWRDFSEHKDVELLEELAKLQAQRTAQTVWVKIKSHASVELNERADRLAAGAPFAAEGGSKMYVQQDDCHLMRFYKQGEGGPVQASARELLDHFISLRGKRFLNNSTKIVESDDGSFSVRTTSIVQKLTAKDVGREYLSTILWSEKGQYSVEGRVVKRMLQCITNTSPTQAVLFRMGKSVDSVCRFCSANTSETLFHWQCECSQFGNARTKVHNDIWSEVCKTICAYLPKGSSGWEFFKETPVKDIFSSMQHHPEHARRQPDGVFCDRHEAKYVLVDFTRGYGWTREALAKQEDTKRRAYDQLMRDLQVQHMVEFFPLACGYNGVIAVDTWRAFMDRMDIPPASQDRVLKLAVRAICLGFSAMVDIRHGCRKATEASSQPG